jgi:hypothetical protein
MIVPLLSFRKERRRNHHIAFDVVIIEEIGRLEEGFVVLNIPKKGADNKLAVFFCILSTKF